MPLPIARTNVTHHLAIGKDLNKIKIIHHLRSLFRPDFKKLTHQVTVPMTSCGVFLSGARMGSPSRPLATMPPAKITSIVDNQHARGCLRENDCAPEILTEYYKVSCFAA